MNTAPSSTLHPTSATDSDRPRSDQDQPRVDATKRVRAAGGRALVLGGGGSTGNAWLIGVIAGSRYIDGGYRSNAENADLAAGYAQVLVLSPFGGGSLTPVDWGMHLATQVDELRAGGSKVETIFPDNSSEHMFGASAMDLSLRPAAAQAGYDQGRARAEQLTEFWR